MGMDMTVLQLYIASGLPAIAVLASLTVSLIQIGAIRDEMRTNMSAIRGEMRTNTQSIHGEVREIREDIREIRSDIKLLTGKVYELMGQKP
jgi:hypothetical protein